MKHALINADFFRAASIVQSKEETRYYLCGVLVEPHPNGGVLLTATDGNRLVNVHDEKGECSEAGIVALPPAIAKECKSKPRDGQRLIQITNGVASVFSIGDAPAKYSYQETIESAYATKIAQAPGNCMVDGTFPDWRRVLPSALDKCSPAPVGFDPAYLASFRDVAEALAPKGNHTVSISSNDDSSPALVRFAEINHAFAVLMPERLGPAHDALSLPAYLQAKPTAASIAA